MAVKGSCVCGSWTYEYEGEPAAVSICHCKPCQKSAGTNGSFNLLIPQDKFKKLSGDDHLYERVGDSGKTIKYQNCAKCSCVMVASIEALPGLMVLKGGTVDDPEVLAKNKPATEIYRKNAPEWCTPFAGTVQMEGAK